MGGCEDTWRIINVPAERLIVDGTIMNVLDKEEPMKNGTVEK